MRRLILRPGAIGDCILSLPALEHLVTNFTEIWVPAPIVSLVRFGHKVRALSATNIDLFGIEGRALPKGLPEILGTFDSIVSWYGTNRPEFREAILALGISCEFHTALPDREYPGHAAKFFADQVGADPNIIPHIDVPKSSPRNSVIIHPFSGSRAKNWPLPYYEALASRINAAKIEWTAGPEEALDGAIRFRDLAELATWISGARLYIGNDSGITHLAAAVGIPTLALFGPTDPARWAPLGENVTVLRHEPIQNLPVGVVLEAANLRLSSPWRDSSI
jgi:lipopolysaccharide heptosyltransferase III